MLWEQNREPIPVMSTKHSVTEAFAFAVACRDSDIKSPHAAKHSIAAERDARPLPQLERKAWSENMGHENEQIIERHYGKLPDDRRIEVLENIGANNSTDFLGLSDEAKVALFDGILGMLGKR